MFVYIVIYYDLCIYDFPKLVLYNYSQNTYCNHRIIILTVVYYIAYVCVMVEYYMHASVRYGLHLTAGKCIPSLNCNVYIII